jgi:hypothetical protein
MFQQFHQGKEQAAITPLVFGALVSKRQKTLVYSTPSSFLNGTSGRNGSGMAEPVSLLDRNIFLT